MFRKKWLASLLSVMMVFAFMPISSFVYAAEGEEAPAEPAKNYEVVNQNALLADGLYTSKSLSELDENGNGTITIEMYSEGDVTTTTSTKPVDVVLVLDMSGSMDWCVHCGNSKGKNHKKNHGHEFESRIAATKAAANNFIDKVATNAQETGNTKDHRIAIVTFAGSSATKCSLTSVKTAQGVKTLKDTITNLNANGATRADLGMTNAKNIINGISSDRDSSKIVIMLTDGEPTSGNSFETWVANGAIDAASGIKSKAKVYTVGMFSGTQTNNTTNYMNYVSSNYPSATSMSNHGTKDSDKYYLNVGDQSSLNNIFETISSDIITSRTNLTKDSLITDVISDKFKLNGNVNAEAYNYTGKNSEGVMQWTKSSAATGVTLNVNESTKTINAKGFDFQNNCIIDKDGRIQGQKLVITIPVTLTDKTLNGVDAFSNGEGSGVKEKQTDTSNTRDFDSPKVKKATKITYEADNGGSVTRDHEVIGTNQGASDVKGSTAEPAEGYTFVNWTDSEGNVVSTDATFKPDVAYETYTAHFAKIVASDCSKKYDGEPLIATAPTIEGVENYQDIYRFVYKVGDKVFDNGLPTGFVDVGQATVEVIAVPNDDYDDQYNELKTTFKMEVTPRTVTLKSESETRAYNGIELTKPHVTVGGDGFVEGEVSNVHATGAITNVGKEPNTIAYNKSNKFNAENYKISKEEGTLEITKRVVTIKADDAWKYEGDDDPSFTYDISSGSLASANDLGTISVVRTNPDENTADVYKKVLEPKYTPNDNYTVYITNGDFTIKAASLKPTLETADGEWTYDGGSHSKTATVTGEGKDDYTVYYKVGNGEWTTEVPTITNAESKKVQVKATAEGKEDLTGSYTLKVNPRDVVITVKDADKAYGANDPAFEIASITKGSKVSDDKGALIAKDDLGDITAYRTDKNAENGEEVGKHGKVLDANYTANSNYNVTVNKGEFEITQAQPVGTLENISKSKVYDATALKADAKPEVANAPKDADYEIYYSANNGETWTKWDANHEPSVVNVADSKIFLLEARDANKRYGTISATASLTVTPSPVTIKVSDMTKTYGDSFGKGDITGTVEGFVAEGDLNIEYDFASEKPTAAGTYKDILTAKYDIEDGNYTVTVDAGDLTINQKHDGELYLDVNGSSRMYNGQAFSGTKPTVNKAPEDSEFVIYYSLNGGDTWNEWTESSHPSITDVDTLPVKVKAEDKTKNYETLTGDMALAVTPRTVNLSTETATKEYDGKSFSKPEVTIEGDGFVAGEATVSAPVSIKNVSESGAVNKIEISGSYKAQNYVINKTEGKLFITPATLTVTPDNQTKNAGTADPEFTGKIEGFVNGEDESVLTKKPTYSVNGNTNVPGTYTIIGKGGEAENYVFEYAPATLTVNSVIIPPGPGPNPGPGPGNGGGGGNVGTIVPATMAPAAAYSLTEVPNEGTPLGNGLLDDHCCILHLLIMLAALIMLMYYTHDMKKRQARIFELEDELEGYDE